jgi:excisionase family DNA binding protein
MVTTMRIELDPAVAPTLSVDEAANVLGVGRSTAYTAVHSGEIPSIRVGKRIRVPTAAVRRMLDLDPLAASTSEREVTK